MKIDVNQSKYHEAPEARREFNRAEIRSLRLLLRRLRFLEAQVREGGGLSSGSGSGGAAFAEWEVEALEWIMTEVGFLADRDSDDDDDEGITYSDAIPVSRNAG
jgi:hypothetical protein